MFIEVTSSRRSGMDSLMRIPSMETHRRRNSVSVGARSSGGSNGGSASFTNRTGSLPRGLGGGGYHSYSGGQYRREFLPPIKHGFTLPLSKTATSKVSVGFAISYFIPHENILLRHKF